MPSPMGFNYEFFCTLKTTKKLVATVDLTRFTRQENSFKASTKLAEPYKKTRFLHINNKEIKRDKNIIIIKKAKIKKQ